MTFSFILVQSLLLLLLFPHDSHSQITRCGGSYKYGEALTSGANDVVVVRQTNGDLVSTQIQLQIGKFSHWYSVFSSRKGRPVRIIIGGQEFIPDSKFLIESYGNVCFKRQDSPDTFTGDELKRMNLKSGLNNGLFVVDAYSVKVPFSIFLLDQSSKLVVTDIDGTITESDVKGYVYPQFGMAAHQDNVIELFQKISDNGYTMVYITARSMGNDADTRKYLFKDLQNQAGFSIPAGPLFMSPMPFNAAIFEAMTSPTATKAATINGITKLFDRKENVIYGAYGNAKTDVEAYLTVKIRPSIIYLVNEEGKLRSLANGSYITSYGEQAQQVDQLYPR